MCLTHSSIRNLGRWNWDGGKISQEPIVPSGRPVVGTRSTFYEIDVREFLVTERNATMHETLEHEIADFISRRKGKLSHFRSRDESSFDYRAAVITDWVSQEIGYGKKGQNYWQFPDETLKLRSGLCEDRALLLASLLLGSGISSFNIRVALGKLVLTAAGGKSRVFDHMWVMYKNEAGQWKVLEPKAAKIPRRLAGTVAPAGMPDSPKAPTLSSEYCPEYLFNDVHLWDVHPSRKSLPIRKRVASQKRKWKRIHPRFIGVVHKSILRDALYDFLLGRKREDLFEELDSHFFHVAGVLDIVEDLDYDTTTYDPRQHFDNGYIEEGWALVMRNLEDFSRTGNLDAFARAAHAIGDFYSHSSYGHFAVETNGSIEPFNPDRPDAGFARPDYGPLLGFDLSHAIFSVNKTLWRRGLTNEVAAAWDGRLISGRYAQDHDTWPGLLNHLLMEGVTYIPKRLTKAPDFHLRGGLPHHNEIAVDHDPDKEGPQKNRLYGEDAYAKQFALRRGAAVKHIRKVFERHWDPATTPRKD